MGDLLTGIRNAVRALIVEDDRVLLLHKRNDAQPDYYALPGGAQELGETLIDALQRECLEEIGSTIRVDELVGVADYTKARSSPPGSRRQLVEFLFQCRLPVGYRPQNGPKPDRHQQSVVWVERSRVASLTLTPEFFRQAITSSAPFITRYMGAFADRVDTP